jgi:zinc and cadmium transporter
MATSLAFFCVAIVGVSLMGGLLPLATVLTHTRLQMYLSFSAGVMLGAVFFHMFPEAVRLGGAGTLRWAALGLLALFFLERFFAFHHHESPAPAGAKAMSLDWGAAAIGLAAHSLTGGVALASAAAAGGDFPHDAAPGGSGAGAAAWGVFVATLVHKPADALTIVSLMLRAGAPRTRAHLVNLGFAMMIPAGVAVFFLGIGRLGPVAAVASTASALAFSGGTFLCIALSDLLPELHFHSHDRAKLSVSLVAGILLMLITSLAEPARP